MRKHIVGLAIAALTTSALTTVGMSGTAHADDSAAPQRPTITGHPDSFEVTHTPAPRTAQRKASGKFTVYPVPTSAAGLQRITTAPDGSMWFVERDRNRIGRITTSGVITEFGLSTQTVDDTWVKDLDVDAAGNVWVVWDQGWKISRFNPKTSAGYTWELDNPYGDEVRVGPNGTTWVTTSFDENGIVRISGNNAVWDPNAPECDSALGRGRDGLMWCQAFDKLIRVNAAGNGGTAYPLPTDATYPYSVATGPTQKIWFGRDNGGSMFTYPAWGNIGWIGNDNQAHVTRIGDRTAPRSLVTGRDGNVWFVSIGAAKGIGHINPKRVGAVTKVGNYEPTALTYGKDGAIWFTDESNNSIVRVTRAHLWATTVNLGRRSQLRPHPQPKVKFKSTRVDANAKRKKATFSIRCGAGKVKCSGKVKVKAGKAVVAKGTYTAAQKSAKKVTVKLNKKARKRLKKKAKVAVKIVLVAATGAKTKAKGKLTR